MRLIWDYFCYKINQEYRILTVPVIYSIIKHQQQSLASFTARFNLVKYHPAALLSSLFAVTKFC